MSAQQKPFAWAYQKKKHYYPTFSESQEWAVGMVKEFGGEAIPLYRQPQPTLTDAEREAIEMAYSRLTADAKYTAVAATLRGLLDRTAATHATPAQVSTPDGCTVQNDGSKSQRLADYRKWLRTPYCEGHGCQCKGGGE